MDEFTARLDQVLTHFDLSSSQFSDKIGVPRSSLSHIISGRNKPSLDFIIKIRDAFPTINLYWLIYGFEPFLLEHDSAIPTHILDDEMSFLQSQKTDITNQAMNENTSVAIDKNVSKVQQSASSSANMNEQIVENTPVEEKTQHHTDAENIVVLYTDGTFKSYRQR